MESDKVEFSLSQSVIKDIPFHKYAKDFAFIVDGVKYTTPRVVADIISPLIRNFHFEDESAQEFYIDTKNGENSKNSENEDNSDDYFSKFLKLHTFDKQTLCKKE